MNAFLLGTVLRIAVALVNFKYRSIDPFVSQNYDTSWDVLFLYLIKILEHEIILVHFNMKCS